MGKKVLNYTILLTFLTTLFGGMFYLFNDNKPMVDTEKINQEIIELKKEQDEIMEMAEKTVDGIMFSDSLSKHKIDSLNRKNTIKYNSLKNIKHELDSVKKLLDVYKKQILNLEESNTSKNKIITDYEEKVKDLTIKIKKLKINIGECEEYNHKLNQEIKQLKELTKIEKKVESTIPSESKNKLFKKN